MIAITVFRGGGSANHPGYSGWCVFGAVVADYCPRGHVPPEAVEALRAGYGLQAGSYGDSELRWPHAGDSLGDSGLVVEEVVRFHGEPEGWRSHIPAPKGCVLYCREQ